MHDTKQENAFYIIVNSEKLEEIRAKDDKTYVIMPLFSPVSYGVEFVEEVKGHGAKELISQKWPVCPYTVLVKNNSDKGNFAELRVDGQKVASKYVRPRDQISFEGIPTQDGIQELLFSLPRYATLREKSIGGRALPNSMTSDLGTVQVMWRDCVKTGTSFDPSHKTYKTTSYTQGNKDDASATGGGSAGAGAGRAFASTTRAGKVVGLNESRSCKVTNYTYVGEPWSSRLFYRTREYLADIRVIENNDEEKEERLKRRAQRKKRKLEQAQAEDGGAPCPPSVPIEDTPPSVPAKEEKKRVKAEA